MTLNFRKGYASLDALDKQEAPKGFIKKCDFIAKNRKSETERERKKNCCEKTKLSKLRILKGVQKIQEAFMRSNYSM